MKTFKKQWSVLVLLGCMLVLASTVFAQEEKVIIPNVEGIPQDVAAQLLRTAGLQPTVKLGADRSIIVISQSPKPGVLVSIGSEVILSTGMIPSPETSAVRPSPQTVSSPSVNIQSEGISPATHDTEKKTLGQPPEILRQENIPYRQLQTAQTSDAYLPWIPKRFLSQPSARGVGIRIQSQGKETQTLRLLYATAASTSQQKSILVTPYRWQQGWQRTNSSTTFQTSQAPGILSVPPSTQSGQSASVAVPAVIRLRPADASAALRKAGLSVGGMTYVVDYQSKGLVVRQEPSAATVVAPGTRVNLWVGKE